MVWLLSSAMSSVLNPAVRAVIDWNREARTRFCHGSPLRTPLCSKTKKTRAPPADQDRRGDQDDLGVHREPSLAAPQAHEQLVVHDEADAAGHDEPHHREVDQHVPLEGHQAVGEQRVAAVVEGRHGVVDRLVERLAGRQVLAEPRPEQQGAGRLAAGGGDQHEFEDGGEVAARRVQEDRLNDVPLAGGQPPAHHHEEHGREGDDPQPAHLKQDQGDGLAEGRKVLADADHGQAGDAHGRGRGEQGVQKRQGPVRRGGGQPQQRGPQQDEGHEAQDEDPLRGEAVAPKRVSYGRAASRGRGHDRPPKNKSGPIYQSARGRSTSAAPGAKPLFPVDMPHGAL